MNRQLLAALALVVAVSGAWWAGYQSAVGPAEPVYAPLAAHKAKPAQVLRVPKLSPSTVASVPAEIQQTSVKEVLEKLMHDGSSLLTLSQVQRYLADNHRNAESLVTASRLTGDMSLLREAVARFPNDPRAQMDLALRSDVPEEKKKAAEALAAADPSNAMGSYLAAQIALKTGNGEDAVRWLTEAAARPSLDDYSKESQVSAEEAYLAAGLPPLEAKVKATFGLPVTQGSILRDLGVQMQAMASTYSQSGDSESAQTINGMGVALGQRIADSLGSSLIMDLIGMSVESRFLKSMDPQAQLGTDGMTVQKRLDQVAAAKEVIGKLAKEADITNLSPQFFMQYLDRNNRMGEQAALQWLCGKLKAQSP